MLIRSLSKSPILHSFDEDVQSELRVFDISTQCAQHFPFKTTILLKAPEQFETITAAKAV